MTNRNLQIGKRIQWLFSCLLVIAFTLPFTNVHAQMTTPCAAHPFCSDSNYVFNNTSGNILTAPASPPVNYGVLGSEPNPVWYWMQVGTAGTMQLTIIQTSAATGAQIDVDFAMWGPFTDLPTGCAAILAGAAPIQSSYDGTGTTEVIGLGLPGGSGVGLSGTPNPPGGTTPPAATVGQIYIVILTNYSNQPGTISFSQTAGTGSADCGIICGLAANNSGNACMGNSVIVSASNPDTTLSWSYSWTDNNGFTANSKNFTFVPTASGVYNFNVTAVSSNSDTCHATTSVTIFPKPNVALVDATNKVLCNTGSTPLAIANPTAGDSYQWYKDGVAMVNDTLPQISVDTNGTYKVVAHNANGCADSSLPVSVTLNFTHVDFSFLVDKACTNDTVKFTNLSEPGQYWWSYGDGTLPEDTIVSPTHIYNVQSSYIVRLKMIDLDGCLDSAVKIVNTLHPINASFTQSVDSICQNAGIPVQFTNTSTGAITGQQWFFGDGVGSNQQSPSHIYTVSGMKTVQLIVHDDIPCYDTALSYVRIDSVPFLSFTQDRHAICEGEKVNFTPDYLQTALKLSWNFGDGTIWNQFGNTSHSYDHAGTYTVTLKGDYGTCGIATRTDSVVVNAFPVVNLGPDTVLCLDGPSITVTDINNVNDPTVKWLWSTGATTPSISIVHPGIYSVTATRMDCATTENVEVNKDCYTDIPNAFSPNNDGVNDYFYPRQLLSKGVVSFTMVVFDRWGEKVFETATIDGRGWDGKFNGKDQPMGVYIYQINAVLKNGRTENYNGNLTLVR